MRHTLLAALLCLAACRTVRDEIGVEGGTTARARLSTTDGAAMELWRWAPRALPAEKVLVVPEIGFDHRLVAPLCARLRDAGFDVATLDGRDVTGAGGRYTGLSGWTIDVARAIAAHGPRLTVVAVGLGGSAALPLADEAGLRGVIAVNVPLRRSVGNEALRIALSTRGFDPLSWSEHGLGALLLAGGRSTDPDTADRLRHLAHHPTIALSLDAVEALRGNEVIGLPRVPVRAIVSVKDNLIVSEDALPDAGGQLARVRRLSRVEGFRRDYGHLDWLVEPEALAEVSSVIIGEIEAMP